MQVVIGLYDTFAEARQATQALLDNGFGQDDVSVLANAARLDQGGGAGTIESSAVETMGSGAVGASTSLPVGYSYIILAGIGMVVIAGPLALLLERSGSGNPADVLVSTGVPNDDAQVYVESVRRGGALVVVNAPDDRAGQAASILAQYNIVDISELGAAYRDGGWAGVDPSAGGATAAAAAWEESSKAGTIGGAIAGAATGAAIGSVGGPVGTVLGSIAGAVTGAGLGAAGDAAGEAAESAISESEGNPTVPDDPRRKGGSESGVTETDDPFSRTTRGYSGDDPYPQDNPWREPTRGYSEGDPTVPDDPRRKGEPKPNQSEQDDLGRGTTRGKQDL